jgi:peptidoglycan/LPS O-acetylase OafA/YrhL
MAATADIATGAAALGLTLLIAKGSWVLFEKPLIKLGHSFTY